MATSTLTDQGRYDGFTPLTIASYHGNLDFYKPSHVSLTIATFVNLAVPSLAVCVRSSSLQREATTHALELGSASNFLLSQQVRYP